MAFPVALALIGVGVAGLVLIAYMLGFAHGRLREMDEQRELDERADDTPAHQPAGAPVRSRASEWL